MKFISLFRILKKWISKISYLKVILFLGSATSLFYIAYFVLYFRGIPPKKQVRFIEIEKLIEKQELKIERDTVVIDCKKYSKLYEKQAHQLSKKYRESFYSNYVPQSPPENDLIYYSHLSCMSLGEKENEEKETIKFEYSDSLYYCALQGLSFEEEDCPILNSSITFKSGLMKGKKPKLLPNYFFGIHIKNPTIISKVQSVQNLLKQIEPNLDIKDYSKLHKLHVTLFVMHIPDSLLKDEKSMKRLNSIVENYLSDHESFNVSFKGIGNFDLQVLWMGIEQNSQFEKLIQMSVELREAIKFAFPEILFDNKEFVPHVTLWKKRKSRKVKKIPSKFFHSLSSLDNDDENDNDKDFIFGEESIHSIDLLDMNRDDPEFEHYYYRFLTFKLRNI